ncbi:PHP domain-containing protein [Candidatus Sumerlaeota bacterium]|nr:PHP domain-containing protein [Candidatus Sumerlaeota bacterium]
MKPPLHSCIFIDFEGFSSYILKRQQALGQYGNQHESGVMMACDLHIHSTASDGSFTPSQVVDHAWNIGLTCISLTDHDTVEGIEEAETCAREHGVPFIPGIEMTTVVDEHEIHILGYFIDYRSPDFHNFLKFSRDQTYCRLSEIVSALSKQGYSLTMEEVSEIAGPGSMGRPHVAQAMVRHGYVENTQEAFERFIGSDGLAYVPPRGVHSKEAYRVIAEAGGVSAFAHPGQGGRADMVRDHEIELHREWGARALEVFHPRHDDYMINYYLKLAHKLNLGIVGGSDCHGAYYPKILMDRKLVPDWVAEKIREFHDKLSLGSI